MFNEPPMTHTVNEEALKYSEVDENKFFSSTFTKISTNLSVIKQSEIPLALTIQPESLNKEEVPVSQEEIVRCTSCKTYINPFIEVIPPGLKWKCNICFTINELSVPFQMVARNSATPSHKFSLLNNAIFNFNTYSRTELRSTVYELYAPSNYSIRTPSPTLMLFLIEASYDSIKNGVLHIVLRSIIDNINHNNFESRAKMGFIFFNSQVFVLNKDNGLTVIPETTFIPHLQEENFLFDLSTRPNLEDIEKAFGELKSPKNCLGDALKVAQVILKKNGGTILTFLNTSPNYGVGAIDENDKESVNCKSVFYKELAGAFAKSVISLSLFLFPKVNIELPTLSVLSKSTGGMVFYYPNFDGGDPVFSTKVHSDLNQFFNLDFSHDCVCRIRTSKDVFIKEYNGSLSQKTFDLLSFPNIFPPHTFSIELEIVDNIQADGISLQIALMRTTKQGNRMIKVINLQIPQHKGLLYDFIDPYAITRIAAIKSFYYESRNKGSGLTYLYSSLIAILKAYKKSTSSFSLSSLPNNLNVLPLLTLSLSKSIPLRPVSYTPVDYKVFYMYLMSVSYASLIDTIIYPILLPLHLEEITPQNLTRNCLETSGLYILDTGFTIFFFIGKDCPSDLSDLLFDSSVPSGRIIFEPPQNEFSARVISIINELREQRFISPFYVLIRDNLERTHFMDIFFSYLYEDYQHNLPSISEYYEKLKGALS